VLELVGNDKLLLRFVEHERPRGHHDVMTKQPNDGGTKVLRD
jgi:hypothetical protein